MQETTYVSAHPISQKFASDVDEHLSSGNSYHAKNLLAVFFNITAVAVTATTLATLLALAGCASAPIPSEQLAISQATIDSATAAGATEYAPLEIKSARDKLTAAQRAIDEKQYEVAAALAEEASVDAKLAQTKAQSEKSKKSVSEIQDNLRTLLDEINRNSQQQTQSQPSS